MSDSFSIGPGVKAVCDAYGLEPTSSEEYYFHGDLFQRLAGSLGRSVEELLSLAGNVKKVSVTEVKVLDKKDLAPDREKVLSFYDDNSDTWDTASYWRAQVADAQ